MRLSACLGCFIHRGGCRVLPEESRSWIWSADRDPRGAPAQGWQYLEIWTSTPSACTFWWIQTDSKLRKLTKWPIKFTFNAAQHSCKMKANFKINQLKKKNDNSRNKLPGLECKQFCFSITAASRTVTSCYIYFTPWLLEGLNWGVLVGSSCCNKTP